MQPFTLESVNTQTNTEVHFIQGRKKVCPWDKSIWLRIEVSREEGCKTESGLGALRAANHGSHKVHREAGVAQVGVTPGPGLA